MIRLNILKISLIGMVILLIALMGVLIVIIPGVLTSYHTILLLIGKELINLITIDKMEQKLMTHIIELTIYNKAIYDLQFHYIADFLDALDILRHYECNYMVYHNYEGDYQHIVVSNSGYNTLKLNLE